MIQKLNRQGAKLAKENKSLTAKVAKGTITRTLLQEREDNAK